LAALSGCVLLLGACGGSGNGGDGVATLSGDGGNQAAEKQSDDQATPEEAEEAFRKYAQCMREEGIDMPDPQTSTAGGEGGPVMIMGERVDGEGGDGPSPEEFEAANKKCEHFTADIVRNGPGQIDPEQEAAMRDRALAFAQCMRDHGIDMPDPTFGDNGVVQQEFRAGTSDPMDDDDFQAAQEACAEKMGKGEDGGPGFMVSGGGGATTKAGK
jgi:hypothetical protein